MELSEAIRSVSVPMDSQLLWPQTVRDFEALVDSYQHELVRYAFSRVGNLQDAEDAVQEVLVRAYRDREKRKGITGVAPYLYRAVANQCTDIVRRRRLEPPAKTEPSSMPSDSAHHVAQLLAGLPDRESEVIRLRIFSELPFDAIAKIVGRPLPTVKSRFRYGIEKLRKTLCKGGRAL